MFKIIIKHPKGMNICIKPNEQSQTCLFFAMASKYLTLVNILNIKGSIHQNIRIKKSYEIFDYK